MKATDFKKRMESAEKELERLSGELDGLKQQRATLDVEITAAIDADDFGKVEKLTAKHSESDNRIRAAELIISRKKETSAANRPELIAANNAEMQDFQKRIDKAQAAADDTLREYFRKLLEVAALVNQAWITRAGYVSILPGIEDPTTTNAQTNDFAGVSCAIRWNRTPENEAVLKSIAPDAISVLNDATRSHYNQWAGRNWQPRDPGVIISKH